MEVDRGRGLHTREVGYRTKKKWSRAAVVVRVMVMRTGPAVRDNKQVIPTKLDNQN